jgi:hypothetical protein
MAPIVHGLEQQWQGRVDFLYLDVADSRNAAAMQRLGYQATPHFFLLDAGGRTLRSWIGTVEGGDLLAGLRSATGGS